MFKITRLLLSIVIISSVSHISCMEMDIENTYQSSIEAIVNQLPLHPDENEVIKTITTNPQDVHAKQILSLIQQYEATALRYQSNKEITQELENSLVKELRKELGIKENLEDLETPSAKSLLILSVLSMAGVVSFVNCITSIIS